jgi:iron complex transport system permease protein
MNSLDLIYQTLVFGFEIERIISTFCVGLLLSLSGSLIQISTQNELASPSTLGMDAIVIFVILLTYGIWYFLGWDLQPPEMPLEYFSLLLCGILGTLVSLFFLFKKFKFRKRNGNFLKGQNLNAVILLGLCLNLFLGTIFTFGQFLFVSLGKQFPQQLWYGNFRFIVPYSIFLLVPVTFVIYGMSLSLSRSLQVMSFGTDFALGQKIPVRKIFFQCLVISFSVQIVVGCLYGVFSFSGLIFPLLLRSLKMFKSNVAAEIKWGSLLSGLIFCGVDIFVQENLFFGSELPVGLVSSAIGTFWLLILIFQGRLISFRSQN